MFNIFGMPNVPNVEVDVLKKALDGKEPVVILDVRTEAEYAKSHIAGSVHLPLEQVGQIIAELVPDKNSEVYVYCLSGSRSVYAVDQMTKMGYTNVFNVTSGLLAWRGKQYPLVS